MAEASRVGAERRGRSGVTARELVHGHESAKRPSFLRDARGATAIEYALIAGLIFVVVAGGMRLLASGTGSLFGRVGSAVAQLD